MIPMNRSILLLLALLIVHSAATIHDFRVSDDGRNIIPMDEGFGFIKGGRLYVRMTGFKIQGPHDDSIGPDPRVGVFIYKDDRVLREIDLAFGNTVCLFDTNLAKLPVAYEMYQHMFPGHINESVIEIPITSKNEGFYRLFFANCEQYSAISLNIHLNYSNPGPTYLTAGLAPMPGLYLMSTIMFIGALVAWIVLLYKRREKVMKIHIFMALTVFVKICALVAQTLRYAWIRDTGSEAGWNIIYYIFHGCRVLMVFGIIAVIGSGFLHFRAFVPVQTKRLLAVIIPMQILANIAQIVSKEESPGIAGWSGWYGVYFIVDIICCVAIVGPVEYTLKQLSNSTDQEDVRTTQHIRRFRKFYYWCIAYLYFTRLLFTLWDRYILYTVSWMPKFGDEILAFIFFVVTGWLFAPPGTGYFRVYASDDENVENDGERIEMDQQTGDV